jgi:hypothetical protein
MAGVRPSIDCVASGDTSADLLPGAVTGIGSLPYTDTAEAVRCALRHAPLLPAAPQLPRRDPNEGMLAQAVAGLPGVNVDVDGRIVVPDTGILAIAHDIEAIFDPSFDPTTWGGLLAFLDAIADRPRRVAKLQITGPITLGLALVDAGLPADAAFTIAAGAVRSRGRALIELAATRAPQTPLVVFLDEPGLVALPRTGFPLETDEAIDLLSSALAVFGDDARTGVHCCGPTDWRVVTQAGPDVLSLPIDAGVAGDPSALAPFLERGGWVAWGVVPTHRPIGERAEVLWRRLVDVWCELTRGGCDPVLLRQQALVTPECGLALHDPAQVAAVFELAAEVGSHIEDQALACRLSVGA